MLQQLSNRAWYMQQAVNQGIFVHPAGDRCVLVDSGLDRSAANKVLRAAAAHGWQIAAVITTHSHADHMGGNQRIVAATGAPVFTCPVEAGVVRHPYWEPVYLYGGASPPPQLRTKLLQAEPSPVDGLLSPGQPLPPSLAEYELEIVDISGHCLQMIAVGGDGVLYAADAFMDRALLDRHGIPYLVDVAATLATLDHLARLDHARYQMVVISHGRAYRVPDESQAEIAANRQRIAEIAALVRDGLDEPQEEAAVLERVLAHYGRPVAGVGQYYLYRTAVAAFLSYLADRGEAEPLLQGRRLVWRRL